jgi:hypothetical protein
MQLLWEMLPTPEAGKLAGCQGLGRKPFSDIVESNFSCILFCTEYLLFFTTTFINHQNGHHQSSSLMFSTHM